MDWLGVRTDVTPVADMPGAAEAAFSVRLRKAGELQRRWGFLSSAIAQQSGPIRYIVASNHPGNNYITLGVAGSPQGFTGGGGGADPWPPPPDGPKKRRPKGDRQGACAIWGPFSDNGTDSGVTNAQFTLPANSCPGQFFFSALEGGGSGGSGAGGDYGYSIDVLADGVPILSTGCLVNDSALANIPAGTLVLDYTVTASCLGGLIPGAWSVSATTP